MTLFRVARIPTAITIIACIAATFIGGPKAGLIVALLAVLEISISFDNAVVNAKVLKTMSERWQQVFLTWGILIAVFGMRLVFPIVIVAVAAAELGVTDVIDLAFTDGKAYGEELEKSYPIIAAFGGIFLLMVFLDYFFDEGKDVHWLAPLERLMSKAGHVKAITFGIAGLVLVLMGSLFNGDPHLADEAIKSGQFTSLKEYEMSLQIDILTAGLIGLVSYLLVKGIADALEHRMDIDDDEDDDGPSAPPSEVVSATTSGPERSATGAALGMAGKAGFASFMYLELLDASFSFDGVIGAFAISQDVVIISVGLGLGALFVRTLTVYLVRAGTLEEYHFLEHGAHWAIGALAVLLFIGIETHVSELITGTLGAGLIILAFWSSIIWGREHPDEHTIDLEEILHHPHHGHHGPHAAKRHGEPAEEPAS